MALPKDRKPARGEFESARPAKDAGRRAPRKPAKRTNLVPDSTITAAEHHSEDRSIDYAQPPREDRAG